jgi:glycosyltransferase involved in cell wall biosynthesis
MKLAIMVPRFPPRWLAGTELATANIARHLAKRGHEVHVITLWDRGLPAYSLQEGVHLHRVSFPGVTVVGVVYLRLKVLLLLKKLDPEIVHAQGAGLGICGYLAKKLFKKPYVIWWRTGKPLPPELLDTNCSRLVLRSADAVITLTEEMKIQIQKTCSGNVFVIPNGVELSEFEGTPRELGREKLGINPEEKILLFVGSLRPVKGLRFLIEAMSIVGRLHPEARLLIVGGGKERPRLEDLARRLDLERTVDFIGEVPHREIASYLAAADMFVLPSLSEGFPNVLLEAMAAGLPIVATNVNGMPEIVEDGSNGFLVDPGDPAAIADRVLALLGDAQISQRISGNNREKTKHYTWASTVDRLEEVYASLGAGRRQG